MLNELKNAANMTRTENGAATHISSGSECVDLFASIGALRNATDEDVINRFRKAFYSDRLTATKILFYARDIRGGLGERKVFRTILKYLAMSEPEVVRKNINLISEYGRWDDLICLFDTPCEKDMLELIKEQILRDCNNLLYHHGENVSLLAKWLPSVNTSSKETVANAKKIVKAMGLSEKAYRKALVELRKQIAIIENNLRERDYTFDYSKQPSRAMLKYRKAFIRNDSKRYAEYLVSVTKGESSIHTGTLYPYDLVNKVSSRWGWGLSDAERKSLDVMWNALENFGNDKNCLCVIDGSGSMTSCGHESIRPIDVAVSLGLYFAERNKGEFANHFITFSEHPRLIEVKGKDFVDKVNYIRQFNECANTNISAVFELILKTAVEHQIPQNEMPEMIYIISDMEFDYCAEGANVTNFQYAKRRFEIHGYNLPNIVFWNVDSRQSQQPVTINDRGVALVSGCSPRIFSMVAGGELDPVKFMNNVIESERYAAIQV